MRAKYAREYREVLKVKQQADEAFMSGRVHLTTSLLGNFYFDSKPSEWQKTVMRRLRTFNDRLTTSKDEDFMKRDYPESVRRTIAEKAKMDLDKVPKHPLDWENQFEA